MKPRALFVGRTRYALPLAPGLARKWDAIGQRVLVQPQTTTDEQETAKPISP